MTRQSDQPSRDRSATGRSGRYFTRSHLLMTLVTCGVVGFIWMRLYRWAETSGATMGVILMGIFLLAAVLMTLGWIRHNVTLSRRYGERRTKVFKTEGDWSHDKLGRPVSVTDWGSLKDASRVVIEIDEPAGRKIYREI